MKKCCKNCKWLDVPRRLATGKRIVYHRLAYRCTYPVYAPVLPESVILAEGSFEKMMAIRRHRVMGDQGTSCPAYQELVK